ncbi:Fe-S cluster assembly protein SufD [Oceanibacterium hippocampi]|uniref:FeS cluster assembly protein SufD n=1 Tax=Oceanibacterium hippocampi TaxID=745714 RepID=A0A1Y5T7K1_9PROT|nr:Fe-S cluster assembly protein SufD [Oceanibacterium hippocampi]SLN57573.1 FeS cluster assembly protein SufD [Oceanibacterium hippocampi]
MTNRPEGLRARYLAAFPKTLDALPGAELGWLRSLRESALARFADLDLPEPRVEDWKYTNLRPLKASDLAVPANDSASADAPSGLPRFGDGARLVFVNGRLDAAASSPALPAGARLLSLGAALAETPDLLESDLGRLVPWQGEGVLALNTAFMRDGYVLAIDPGVEIETPIEIVFHGGAASHAAWHVRNVIRLGEGARATVIESHVGAPDAAYFSNPVTEIFAGPSSALRHYRIQDESIKAQHLAHVAAELAEKADMESFVLTLGAALSRNEIRVAIEGHHVECKLNGIYLQRGTQHSDNTTVIDHKVGDGRADEVYKGVLDDRASGVFQGRFIVREDAQKTDANQQSRAILLSPKARADAKPELEIFADDVKCSHGATIGELDEEPLFYLRARGIDTDTARALLVEAFLRDAIEKITCEPVREAFGKRVEDWIRAEKEGS